MVRRNGWQYPPHSYQVVAITLFFSLAASFYTFLSPFLGHTIKDYVAAGVFSPVAWAVFFLYIRCTAIDPSDPGVVKTKGLRHLNTKNQAVHSYKHKCARIVSQKELLQSNKRAHLNGGGENAADKQPLSFLSLFNILKWLTEGDRCMKDVAKRAHVSQEDLLYCTLCDAEVHKTSKHCRSCDKCVQGFDHHCRWLNNCIGRKNYISFLALMAACLIMLSVETIAGLMVLIRCFKDKHELRRHLTTKLGNDFSIAPFSALVALCTLAPLLASVPLGELFCFHVLLIRKGITTYEYVVAMRVLSEEQASRHVEKQKLCVNSVKDQRKVNSVDVPYFEQLCYPSSKKHQADKRKLPCTVDAESTIIVERTGYMLSKNVVKISALKLAMLNPTEAANAARKARESSSILRPVGYHSSGVTDTDTNFSCNISPQGSGNFVNGPSSGRKGLWREAENSTQITASPRQEITKEKSNTSSCSHSPVFAAPLSPLPMERRFDNPTVLRTSRQHLQMQNLCAAKHGLQVCSPTILPSSSIDHPSWICTTPMTEGHGSSRDSETAQLGRSKVIAVETNVKSEECDISQTVVYWDRAAGRFRSLPKSNHGMTMSSFLSTKNHRDSCNISGPHSISSPGRCAGSAKAASFRGSFISSAIQNQNRGKENLLKVANINSRPISTHSHIVLPTQSVVLS